MRFRFDDFVLDDTRRELRLQGERLRVDPLVVDLLACLLSRAGEIVSSEELIDRVWQGRSVAPNTISVSMAKLRRALRQRGGGEDYVKNVYGRGYRFVGAVELVGDDAEAMPAGASVLPKGTAALCFVGREAALGRLRAAHDDARAGRGSACVVIGEAGLGKTRCLEVFEQSAGAQAPFLWGRARELEGAPPLWPFAQIARSLLAELGAARVRAALGPRFEDLCDLLPELGGDRPGARDPDARFRVYDAVLGLLALDVARAPRVLVLEDLHAADAGTLDLLAYVMPELSRLPLLVLGTLRRRGPEPRASEPPSLSRALDHRSCARIELAPLGEAEVLTYATSVLGHASAELARAIHERSAGNPLFMVELVRSAGEGGDADALGYSEAALDLMRARVRRLDDDARGLLSAAATIGRAFDLGLLGAVTELPPAKVLERLEDAFSGDVVVASSDDQNRFVFAHELLREVLYEDLPEAARRKLRLRIGEALERRRESGAQVSEAELAHCFLGALPEGSALRAIDYARKAAERASVASSYADAAALLRRALRALDLMTDPPARLRCELTQALSFDLRACDVPAGMAELERAATLAREHGFGDLLVLACQMMAPSPGVVALPATDAHLRAALALLPPEDQAMRAIALAHLAWTRPCCDSRKQSTHRADEALDAARASGSQEALAAALRAKLHLGGGPERPEHETAALIGELRELTRGEQHHARARTAFELCNFEMVHALQRGDLPAFEHARDGLAEVAERYRFTELQWYRERLRVVEDMAHGRFADVPAQLDGLRATGERLRLYAYEMMWGLDLMIYRQETAGLDPVSADWVEPALPPTSDPPSVRALKLRAALDLGQLPAARRQLASFVEGGLRELPCDRDYLGTLAHLAAAGCALDERAAAAELYALLSPHAEWYACDVSLHPRGSITHYLGLLARTLGRLDEARAHLQLAITRNEAMGLLPRAAESRYELARTLYEGAEGTAPPKARALRERALHDARAMGMRPLSDRLDALG